MQGDRAAYQALGAADIRVHEPGEPDGCLAYYPRQARLREQGHRTVTAKDSCEGDQVVPGIDIDQRGLVPGVAQDCSPAMRHWVGTVRERLVIQRPRATGLRRASEVQHRRAEGVGFFGQDPVGDKHQFGQREPGGRPYCHP